MKNNTATLDCVTKLITFKFKNEIFTVDIKEGYLHDSWNGIITKDDVVWDFNFSWEDTKGCKPSLTIYGTFVDEEDGFLTTDWENDNIIKIGKSNADVFFKEERFGYKFDVTSKIVGRLYNDKAEEVFKTKSFNKLCDELYIRQSRGCDVYGVIMDKNNATKLIKDGN